MSLIYNLHPASPSMPDSNPGDITAHKQSGQLTPLPSQCIVIILLFLKSSYRLNFQLFPSLDPLMNVLLLFWICFGSVAFF